MDQEEYITWIQINRRDAWNGGFQLMIDWQSEEVCTTQVLEFDTLEDMVDSAQFNNAIQDAKLELVQGAIEQAKDILQADCAKRMSLLTDIVKEVY